MCYAIPIFKGRVAPRCTIADYIIFLIVKGRKIVSRRKVNLKGKTWIDLERLLYENDADILICGGINQGDRKTIEGCGMMIIDNVSCTGDEVQSALMTGKLHSGYGLINDSHNNAWDYPGKVDDVKCGETDIHTPDTEVIHESLDLEKMDCLSCADKVCLKGQICRPGLRKKPAEDSSVTRMMLESALDIRSERERTLCRLSELIYFCLGMKYRKIGIAFCIDLFEQTEILTKLLRRFFEVYPICCKIGGNKTFDPHSGMTSSIERSDFSDIACNPEAQAEMLNKIGTDINIIVGLCMGVDCIFTKTSKAPVSTIFVKDKSLAHNPIGALYSDYYLKEIAEATLAKT